MKRRVYALLLTAVAVVAMVAMPVMASSSTTTGTTTATTTTTTTATTYVVEDTTAPATAVSVAVAGTEVAVLATDVKTEVSSVVSNPVHLTNLGVVTSAALVSSFDLTYSGVMPAGGVQIPITVSAGNVGDYAYILHRRADDGQWEKVGEGVLGADRTVVGLFTSFSPVAVLLADASTVVSTVTAPKTGN
ncbi:MAG: hypothetical protein R3Y58_14270 [Eubacteriales bacterium]